MQRVATGTQSATLPAPNAAVGTPGFLYNGAPGIGSPVTVPGPDWFNFVQEELVALALGTGQTLSATVLDQALLAVKRLAGGNVTSISAAGTTTLTADNAGLVMVNATAGAITIDLPAANSANGVPLRFLIVRTDGTANTVALGAGGVGPDTFMSPAWATVAAPTLASGAPLELSGDGVSHWVVNPRSAAAAAPHGRAIFTAVGTSSWTAPAGVTQIWVNACAGGGGGGTNGGTDGCGGGGGAAILGQSYAVVPGTVYPTTVGAGGAGATASGGTGTTGGATSLGSLFSLLGGAGGAPGAGGAAGGSLAGAGAIAGTNSDGGAGGGTPFGPGGPCSVGTVPTPGGFGGGGGGNITTYPGGAGAQGFIEIIW